MDRKLAKQIRAKLTERNGVERVRFRNGEIHCFGVPPNTNARMWWFAGYVQDVEIKGLACLD